MNVFVPQKDDQLMGNITIRVFPEMIKLIDSAMAVHPGRWDNTSHFFRAAAAHFLHYLEEEARGCNK